MQHFTFYVLSEILIEKCSIQASCQFNVILGAIDQMRLGYQRVGHPWYTQKVLIIVLLHNFTDIIWHVSRIKF